MISMRSILEGHTWAILPEKMAELWALAARHDAGVRLDAAALEAIRSATRPAVAAGPSIAVIPIVGVIAPKANLLSDISGATTVDGLRRQFRAALADPEVGAIVFDVDSPGGAVAGVPELAAEILEARGQKPMTAVVNYLCASAAYWLAVSADEIVIPPSGAVGSVGIVSEHVDRSGMLEQAGIKVTVQSKGVHKTEGHPYAPLSEDARANRDAALSAFYKAFTQHVAAALGVEWDAAAFEDESAFGGGRVFYGRDGVRAGLVSRVGTFDAEIGAAVRAASRAARRGPAAEGAGEELAAAWARVARQEIGI